MGGLSQIEGIQMSHGLEIEFRSTPIDLVPNWDYLSV
jgi:hypothetical protein